VAHLVNRERNASNALEFFSTIEVPTGLTTKVANEYIDELDQFESYGPRSIQTAAAAELLRDAGYVKEGGTWLGDGGNPLEIGINTAGSGTFIYNAQTAAQTLSDFGIEAEPVVKDTAGFGEAIDNGSYQMSVFVSGPRMPGRHPYIFYSEFAQNTTDRINMDLTSVPVPYPIGDPSGEQRTVDVTAKIDELKTASDTEARGIVTELAWIYNQSVPILPLVTRIGQTWMRTDNWEYPPRDSKWFRRNPVEMLPKLGKIQWKDAA
jgi:peptide/nickel transport system substrate-binding protein